MSNIICHLFGHKRNRGWYGDGLYGDMVPAGIDGIGRAHASIRADCDRCGETYTLARLHLNSRRILDHLAERTPQDLTAALASRNAPSTGEMLKEVR